MAEKKFLFEFNKSEFGDILVALHEGYIIAHEDVERTKKIKNKLKSDVAKDRFRAIKNAWDLIQNLKKQAGL